MTIERYSFNPGVAISPGQDPVDETAKLIIANQRSRQILSAGEYNLTPEIWEKYGSNGSKYNLIVYENGTGTLRLIPVDRDVVTTMLSGRDINEKQGGRTFSIPGDFEIAPIAGPKRGDPTLRVYEIIHYIPGPSPKS